jgi:hypothetical protein
MPHELAKRKKVSESTLRQIASSSGSLFYEMAMLSKCAERCLQTPRDQSLPEIVEYNLAVECFLLHFRVVREFLFPGQKTWQSSDDVVAFDFSEQWQKTDKDWKECSKDEQRRINKLLAHLSYSRPTLAHSWPTSLMLEQIIQSFGQFLRSVPVERQSWFDAWRTEAGGPS